MKVIRFSDLVASGQAKGKRVFIRADLNYVAFMKRFPVPGPMDEQLPYLWGGVAVNWVAWQGMSILGIALADVIPTQWGLGFAGSLALLGITASLLVDRGTWIAAAVAACAAFAAFALPFHLHIVVAIAAAMAVGVMLDRFAPPPAAARKEDAV